ncbi:MAG: D-alanyl-D-alanine carboxypeptidase [Clostridia bacterium]|nr:D-alanyl-D-alanine carboxypeptidase [Clostridia bacterium]
MSRLFYLFMAILSGLLVFTPVAQAEEPEITASAAILMDAATGQIYYEKNAVKQRHPASLTKIMTAIVVIETKIGGEEVKVSSEAAKVYIGSILNLNTGDRVSVNDLVKGALWASANDSTVALAVHTAGTHDGFVDMMNAKAFLLGLSGTHYLNTNGYSKPNHYSTARDLAQLARYCLKNREFAGLVSTKQGEIKLINKQGKEKIIQLSNTNRFLNMYPGANGVKTGTTSQAGNCLLSSATRGGRQLIAVVLKSHNRYGDSQKLMDYGFKLLQN